MKDWKILLNSILKYKKQSLIVVNKKANILYLQDPQGIIFETDPKYALGKNLLDIFSRMNSENSSIYKVLEDEIPRINEVQTLYTYKGNKITSIATTIPLYKDQELIGALEIFEDINNYDKISKNIIELQKEGQDKEILTKKYKENGTIYTLNDIIGVSQQINEIKKKILKIADSSSSVLIYGETGTGKELVAQSIHNSSFKRRKNPFIAQNCAAIPRDLLEGILFGTTSGSFTGALEKPGLFELADGGTIFLDEINSMNLELQAKLLRVLQEGIIRRVGGRKTKKVDVRILTASNTSPEIALEKGYLREDLYYRLNVISIVVPPLRERKEDIPVLLDYFIKIYNDTLKKQVEEISQEANKKINGYNWPGNVRELKFTLENIMNFTEDEIIKLEDIPQRIKDYNNKLIKSENIKTEEKNIPERIEKAEKSEDITKTEEIKKDISDISFEEISPLKDTVEGIERQIIVKALQQTQGNKTAAAKILKIPRQTLNNKINKYDIRERYQAN